MQAELLLFERYQLEGCLCGAPGVAGTNRVRGSAHDYKYSLAYLVEGQCVLRYDNEAGKVDHKHIGPIEQSYSFTTPAALLEDFWNDIDQWRPA